ncbi:MAG: hypothetical protein ACI97A_001883 [Planctomycetota bacterium]|jgi:hypothetical protein
MRLSMLSYLLLLATISSSAMAQRGFEKEPDYFPLGGIQAQAEVEETKNGKGIVIRSIVSKGMADKSGLLVGDIITKVGGKPLGGKTMDEVIDKFCAAVEKTEGKKPQGKYGRLKIVVQRSGKTTKIDLKVRPFPAFSKNDPKKCKKTPKILIDGLNFLADRQQDEGHQLHVSNENHAVATVALAGLAWIGSGKKKYAKNITKAAEFIMAKAGNERDMSGMRSASASKANWNQTNWSLSYATIFLSEYLAQKKRPAVKRRLQEIVNKLQDNQEASGGWAHGPGGKNALDYLELEIMSNLALGGMGMAQRVGVKLDDAKVIRGYHYVKKCTTGGGVAYSPLPGQAGHGDPGRTAGAFWALRQIGKGKALQASMAKYYAPKVGKLYEGHACPTMHIWNGAIASAVLGKKAYSNYWKAWRPFIMASRTSDGAFGCRPTDESRQLKQHTDRTWGPSFVTAHYLVSLMVGQGRYKLLDTSMPKQ